MRGREQTEQNAKKQLKTKGWSDARRAAQRERCLKQKPWEQSSGPRTPAGQSVVARNALRHGFYDADFLALSHLLTRQQTYVTALTQMMAKTPPPAPTHRAH